LETENQVGLCVLKILGWIAASDGEISGDEQTALQQIATSSMACQSGADGSSHG